MSLKIGQQKLFFLKKVNEDDESLKKFIYFDFRIVSIKIVLK